MSVRDGLLAAPSETSKLQRQIERIERLRSERRITQEHLAVAAGIGSDWYRKLVRNPARASAGVVARLLLAVQHYEPSIGPNRLDLLAAYRNALDKICRELGLDFREVVNSDPRRGATADPNWRNAARARQFAIYFLNQSVGHRQKHIAEAVGLTPAAVCLAIRTIEDLRDQQSVGELMDKINIDLTGVTND